MYRHVTQFETRKRHLEGLSLFAGRAIRGVVGGRKRRWIRRRVRVALEKA